MELLWNCRECNSVTNDGWLTLPGAELYKALDALKASDELSKKADGVYTAADLMALPDGGEWSVICRGCYKDEMESAADYDIDLDRIGSYKDALDWTLHLMEKSWFPNTNWEETIRSATPETLDA